MAISEAVEASWTGPVHERRPRRRFVSCGRQPPSEEEELQRCFTLGPEDFAFVAGTRSDRNRLALALLLTWARAERKLASDPAALPVEVVAFVASQLEVSPKVLAGYRRRPATRSAHVAKVCRELGVRPFGSEDERRLSAFVSEKVAHTGNTAALVDAAEDWLVREGVLRPGGETTIERLVYSARAQAEAQLFSEIAGQLGEEQRRALDALCATDEGESVLAHLAAPPRAPSPAAVLAECQRLATVRGALVEGVDWHGVTPNRRRQWAGLARRLYAQALRRYPPEKRHALLLAFLAVRAEEVTDSVVEMFDVLVGRVFSRSDEDLAEARLEQAEAQVEGVRLFREVAQIVLDSTIPPDAVRAEIFRRVPAERLSELVAQGMAGDLSKTEQLFAILRERFPYVRSFAGAVLEALTFEASPASTELALAMEILKTMGAEGRRKVSPDAPQGFIPTRWQKAVTGPAGVDRRAWELSLLAEMRGALRAGELTVVGSRRYTPWDAGLYARREWPRRRESWLAGRRLPEDGSAFVAAAKDELHDLTQQVAGRLPQNPDAGVVGDRLVLSAPDRLEVPTEASTAHTTLTGLLPLVDLAELLMEVDDWVGFSDPLLHLSARREPTPRNVAATRPALFAALVAEATNVGLATMARASRIPYGQLLRVHESCFGEDALREGISALIRYHRGLPLTASFGSGTTSSSDGVRFGVAASGLHARHLPRYFGMRRGVSVYSHVSDQGSQFWVAVVNCQLREATFVLDGLLYQDSLPIREHYTDTHGYTDLLFGLFELLGFRFAPRLRDLPDQTLYRARRGADYGSLNGVLRRTIRDDVITEHWDDLNRLAASLADGLVPPSMLVSKLQGLRRQNSLQQAIQELGRLAKTRHLLAYVDDAALRRRVLVGLNRQERVHAMARAIFFGRQARFPDRGYEAQLNRASALSLAINAIVVWNTRYLAAAGDHLSQEGRPVPDSTWSHLSPLHWGHVHLIGRYSFNEPRLGNRLRPLREKGAAGGVAESRLVG